MSKLIKIIHNQLISLVLKYPHTAIVTKIMTTSEIKQDKQMIKEDSKLRKIHSIDVELNQALMRSQFERTKQQIVQLQQKINEDHKKIKKSKKVYIGTGFTFDLTQFFKFKKVKQLQSGGTIGSIFYEISGSGLSWAILIYSVINSSLICIWILSSKSNKFLILTWRFLFQALLMIPFVLYQKRTINFQNSHKYTFKHILNVSNLKRLYMSSLAMVLWYAVILTAGQWTYMSHALYLGSLTNFFLSIGRHKGKLCHEYEIGGQVAIVVGIFFVFLDTIYFRYDQIKPSQLSYKNNYYLSHTVSQRLAADIIAIATSLIIARFSYTNAGIIHIYPPYLSMLIIDLINVVNMVFFAYFFKGLTFDFSNQWGLFSLFNNNQFAPFFYGGIVLCVGLVISFVLISRLFPNFVVPSMAFFFQPGISTLLLDFFNIQALPRSFSLIGYTIMTPGMLLILLGQWIFVRNIKRQQILQKIKLTQLEQLSHRSSHRLMKNQLTSTI